MNEQNFSEEQKNIRVPVHKIFMVLKSNRQVQQFLVL